MSTHRILVLFLALLFALFSTSCTTRVSKPIDEKIDEIPSLDAVRLNIDTYIDRRVRWGGVIANVINEKDTTVMEIVDFPLNKKGRPQETDLTQGRFLARFKGFLDPVVNAKGREITIVGTINKSSKGFINQFEYTYPEILVDSFRLWQIEKQIEYIYEPYWYGPWYPRYRWSPYYDPWWY